jgi:RNA polymerase sigma factor (sigma-70 family)
MGGAGRGEVVSSTSTMRSDVWSILVRERPRLIRLLTARGETLSDAEDFVQEAFVRLARFSRIDLARLSGLATVATLRIAWETHRREARRHLLHSRLRHVGDESPEELATLRGEAACVLTAAAELPHRERVILQMLLAGVPLKEAAERLGVTYKSAESALGRARVKVRRACYIT